MTLGLSVHMELGAQGHRVIEVYPYAGTGPLPKKTTPEGVRARAALLRNAGIQALGLEAWSHDALDAAIAAVIARHAHAGTARAISCGHDESAIWLPPSPVAK